tara:strand:+ start:202 stop:885 length:684 start_codon:yes stop_codon:yes gene_type:complete
MKKLAICVPTCSYNRNWEKVYDSLLVKIFLNTLASKCPEYEIDVYIGYNDDDQLFSDFDNRTRVGALCVNTTINLKWFNFDDNYKGKPANIWNKLTENAFNEGHQYFFCCGDDIAFPKDKYWIDVMIKSLKKNDNKGIAGGDSGNPNLPMTQFLFHRKHFSINGFVFPPLLHQWFCDNWIQEVYSMKNIFYFPQYKFLNLGGDPRYIPKDDRNLCSILVKRYCNDYN